jgi:hypothetical protein
VPDQTHRGEAPLAQDEQKDTLPQEIRPIEMTQGKQSTELAIDVLISALEAHQSGASAGGSFPARGRTALGRWSEQGGIACDRKGGPGRHLWTCIKARTVTERKLNAPKDELARPCEERPGIAGALAEASPAVVWEGTHVT